MMKEYIRQFYNEGFGSIFYKKPIEFIDKRIKNKRIVKGIKFVVKMIYTLLALSFAGYVLYKKLF